MKDIEAITFAAKHGILNLYKKGFTDGNKAANKKIKPMIQEIHDNVYEEGIRKGREEAFKECLKHFDYPHNFQHEKSHIVWQMQEYTKGVDWLIEQIEEQKNEESFS